MELKQHNLSSFVSQLSTSFKHCRDLNTVQKYCIVMLDHGTVLQYHYCPIFSIRNKGKCLNKNCQNGFEISAIFQHCRDLNTAQKYSIVVLNHITVLQYHYCLILHLFLHDMINKGSSLYKNSQILSLQFYTNNSITVILILSKSMEY